MDDRYAAGLFDGEGYVRITRWVKPNSAHIRYAVFGGIGMNHLPVIEALQGEYGGSISQNRHDLRSPKNRIQFVWNFSSQVGSAFLRRIAPFSIVKKDEIDVALKLQAHIDSNPYIPAGRGHLNEGRDAIFAYREELYQEITALKKRSFPPLTT